jgi:hypothetical protein
MAVMVFSCLISLAFLYYFFLHLLGKYRCAPLRQNLLRSQSAACGNNNRMPCWPKKPAMLG